MTTCGRSERGAVADFTLAGLIMKIHPIHCLHLFVESGLSTCSSRLPHLLTGEVLPHYAALKSSGDTR